MAIGIGIDTGGTYTDAVAYDFDTNTVLAKAKARTTREDLTLGIGRALDGLSQEFLEKAEIIALSTTLATNACVENKGGRARLVLLGVSKKVLEWAQADIKYGLLNDDVLCAQELTGESGFGGFISQAEDWLSQADALAAAQYDSPDKGLCGERAFCAELESRFNVPVVAAGELSNKLNVLERGATALLNARLLPVVREFMDAVAKTLEKRGVRAPAMIVRSDASLMTDALARRRPVETILSGPAASLLGGRRLAGRENCLIADMGGTTTDICLVKSGVPVMAGSGIHIGGWRTQVGGVFTDTFALGGDSALRIEAGRLVLCARRVEPLCAAATRWPELVKRSLARLIEEKRPYSRNAHEFLYLVREPHDCRRYDSQETELINALKKGPVMVGDALAAGLDLYRIKSERLEADGVIMRCGLTPTDIMHIKGDFSRYNSQAAVLGAEFFMRCMPEYGESGDINAFADSAYGLVKLKLFENIVRVLLCDKYTELGEKGLEGQVSYIVRKCWDERDKEDGFFGLRLGSRAVFVGIGAPTHVFLPDVARALGAECVIPEHAEVANALGALVADISATTRVEITASVSESGDTYTIHTANGAECFETMEEAFERAENAAVGQAVKEARRRGALGELSVKTERRKNIINAKEGQEIMLRSEVTARASGRVGQL